MAKIPDLEKLFEEFLSFEEHAAARDPAYPGSDAQLQAQRVFAASVAPSLELGWYGSSFWEPGLISLRPAVGGAPEQDARRSAVTLLHELLHEQYTSAEAQVQLDHVEAFAINQKPRVAEIARAAMQWLEDDRVSRAGARDYPSLDPYLLRFGQPLLERFEQAYEGRYFESPWSERPASEFEQLLGALQQRIFSPDQSHQLSPRVAAWLAEVGPVIDVAVRAGPKDVAEAAVEIAERFAATPLA